MPASTRTVTIDTEARRLDLVAALWGIYARRIDDLAACARIVAEVRAVKSAALGTTMEVASDLTGGGDDA